MRKESGRLKLKTAEKPRIQLYALVSMLIVAATAVIYWQTLGFGLTNMDDTKYITENPHVLLGLTAGSVRWALTAFYQATYQPMVWLSYMVDRQIHPSGFGIYHLTNALLHLINSLLLFWVLVRMTGQTWRSGFVAALFAVHPQHVESVAWVAERKDVLSALFWMLAMLVYSQYVRKPRARMYILLTLVFLLGLLAKPMLVTLPLALLLLDYWPLDRFNQARAKSGTTGGGGWFQLVREKLPLLCVAGLFSIVAFFAQRKDGAVRSLDQIPIGERFANAAVSYFQYIGQMLWPTNLAAVYPHPGNGIPTWEVAVSAVGLVIVSVLIFRTRSLPRYVPVGWAWYLLTLLPVIGLISIALHARADRFMYLPSIGLFVVIAWWVPELAAKRLKPAITRAALPICAFLALAALTWVAYVQTGYWSDNLTLFQHDVDAIGDNYVAETQIGISLYASGDLEGAKQRFVQTLRMNPRQMIVLGNLAGIYMDTGHPDQAITIYSKMLRVAPGEFSIRTNYGSCLEMQGNIQEAIRQYRRVVREAPDYIPACGDLGNALLQQGKIDEAIEQYSEILNLAPSNEGARHNLQVALAQKKHPAAIKVRDSLPGK